MKFLVLAFIVAVTAAAPLDDSNGPVEVIVNGVPDGQPLDIGDIVDIKLKEHSDGVVSATNLLHPFTAVGIAEAAAAAVVDETPIAAVELPAIIAPEPVVLPSPVQPEVILPEAIALPSPAIPEVAQPEAVVLPSPAMPETIVPEPVVMPSPVQPEVILPEPVVLPSPVQPEVVNPESEAPEVIEAIPSPAAQLPIGEIFNDGTVQVQVNAEEGVLSTVQSWFNMALNYFNNGVQTTQQIV